MNKYECHITCAREHAAQVESLGKTMRWSFSQIDGDPLMGQQPYCYLTHYHTDGLELKISMALVSRALRAGGVPVLREKIERIVYDTKTGVNEIR